MSRNKAGCIVVLLMVISTLIIGGVGIYLVLPPGKIPTKLSLSAGPSTCREFAELLQAKGMDIRWVRCNAGSGLHGVSHPSIYIVRSKDCRDNFELMGAAAGGGLAD